MFTNQNDSRDDGEEAECRNDHYTGYYSRIIVYTQTHTDTDTQTDRQTDNQTLLT